MKREIGVLALVLATATPLMFSQAMEKNPSPVTPDEFLGPQLIAWSQVQKPQPVAEPLPQSDRVAQRAGESSSEKAQEPPQQQPGAQTLTGTIVKDSGRYVLKVSSSSTTYELDDQDRAQRYEGKQVKVAGTMSAKGDSFHVISIELIS
jgi:hypothetical protein